MSANSVVFYIIIAVLVMALLLAGKRLAALQEELKKRDQLFKKVLLEKEWLLQEIHHRVKNNLQIVISLLNTQSAYLHNEDALAAIRKSKQRMYVISLIHQELYKSDNLAQIDMKWYIKELVDYLKDCFDTGDQIRFILKTDPIKLDVAQAVPLGLILNEAISNAINYAFPAGNKGLIEIFFNEEGDYNCKLRVTDHGIGLPQAFKAEESDSLGMSLINGLTAQLNGQIKMWNDNGLTLEICFKRQNGLEIINIPGLKK